MGRHRRYVEEPALHLDPERLSPKGKRRDPHRLAGDRPGDGADGSLLSLGVGREDQGGAQARRHLPEWQDLPLTWLAIAGLVCLIVGVLVMFFTQSQGYGGLFAP